MTIKQPLADALPDKFEFDDDDDDDDEEIEHEMVANHDILRYAMVFTQSRGDIVVSHPLQSLRDSTSRFWEVKKRMGLDLTYKSAFNLRMDLDAQILSGFQRPPGVLASSMLGFEALTGGLDDFAFKDYLNLPQDSESIRPASWHGSSSWCIRGPCLPKFYVTTPLSWPC